MSLNSGDHTVKFPDEDPGEDSVVNAFAITPDALS